MNLKGRERAVESGSPLQSFNMDIERTSKESRFSRLSGHNFTDRNSRRSSVMSLERVSDYREGSLSKRASLVNAMDLELSNPSLEHMDHFLQHGNGRFSDIHRLSDKSREAYSFTPEIEEKDLARKSQCKIKHQCRCTDQQCQTVHCSCFLTPREICVIGQCCPSCIASKNQYLQQTRGFQLQRERQRLRGPREQQAQLLQLIKGRNCKNMHYMKQVYANEPLMKDLVFCTCKKSHCQKKYCLCYERGQKCGEFCVCIECENRDPQDDEDFGEEEQRRWERYATYVPYDENEDRQQIDLDIQQFLEEPQHGPFNETMQFQPVNFDSVLNSC